MVIVIEAVNEVYSLQNNENVKLFLAGGITNCPDWQRGVIKRLKDFKNLTIYNPRRKNFPIDNLNAAEQQITWEYNHLRDADIISFWFSRGSLNPIVLYELGRWGNSMDRRIVIGMDSEYERKQDVVVQTRLSKPGLEVCENFDDFINELKLTLEDMIEEKSILNMRNNLSDF